MACLNWEAIENLVIAWGERVVGYVVGSQLLFDEDKDCERMLRLYYKGVWVHGKEFDLP